MNMIKDFDNIRMHCQHHSMLSERLNDNFLMDFVAERERMSQKAHQYQRKYKHILNKMPEDFFSRIMAANIIGKTFTEEGLIHRYRNHHQLRILDKEAKEYLDFQVENPWRYCFAQITEQVEKDFFVVQDAFVQDELLIYSPGIANYCTSGHQQSLYFLLINFNGQCWQTYGLIIPMRSFTVDDVYIYGTEVFPRVDSNATFMASVYQDPMPYFMLASGMEYPVIMQGDHLLRHVVAKDEVDPIDTESFGADFKVQWNKGIYRISHPQWSMPPHFATAYYEEKTGILSRYAMTLKGFQGLSELLLVAGVNIPAEEDYSLGLSMVQTMQEILKKKMRLDMFEKYFPEPVENDIPQEVLDDINRYMSLLMPCINSGSTPDINLLARQAGIDFEDAQSIYEQVRKKVGK